MAKENTFLKNAREKGLIDEREIAVVADVSCTNGNVGRAWVFLNGSTMYLYELVGLANLGAYVESLELTKAEVLKSSSFVLGSSLKLKYNEQYYTFKGFAQAKSVIEAVKTACSG